MNDLMSLLYEYAQCHRVMGFTDARAYRAAERLEEKNLTALTQGLSAQSLAALERYRDASLERQIMEEKAVFQAGFTIARELLL